MTGEPTADQRHAGRLKSLIRTRTGIALASTAALLLTAGLTTAVTDTWPFTGDRYCWGSWKEDGKPTFLGDDAFHGYQEQSRTSTETAPTPQRPRGRCTVAVHSIGKGNEGERSTQDDEVTVTYGPAPKGATKRVKWLQDHLGDSAIPIPDGLPGAVDNDQGLLVLPKKCDSPEGRPTVVALESEGETSWSDGGYTATDVELDDARSVAQLLVSAGNHGMKAAGCAARPLRLTSPVYSLPEPKGRYDPRACRIKGLEYASDPVTNLQYQVGAVTQDVQTCELEEGPPEDRHRYLSALMVAEPRLAALFDGITGSKAPARGWRGTGVFGKDHRIVRAQCAGRPVTMLMLDHVDQDYAPRFVAFTNAVTRRLGCPPVASGGSDR